MILGYARVSTADQNLDSQGDALKEAGAGRFFADTITGANPGPCRVKAGSLHLW